MPGGIHIGIMPQQKLGGAVVLVVNRGMERSATVAIGGIYFCTVFNQHLPVTSSLA